jgi:hypothetical protein
MKSTSHLAASLVSAIVGLSQMVSDLDPVRLPVFATSCSCSALTPVRHGQRKLQAVAIQLSDFTAASTLGYCVDGAGKAPAFAQSPKRAYTDAMAMKNFCVSYCGQ